MKISELLGHDKVVMIKLFTHCMQGQVEFDETGTRIYPIMRVKQYQFEGIMHSVEY